MKALVLGGTGFLGQHVVSAFHAAGWEVACGSRGRTPWPGHLPAAVGQVSLDLTDLPGLTRACRGFDVVAHTAGLMSLWERDREVLYRVNVLGTRNVVEACRAAAVGRLLYAGSVGIYGGTSTPQPVSERGAPTAERFHSFHTISMALAEREVLEGIARGLDAVRLHPTLCFGEGDRSQHSSWVLLGLAMGRLAVCPPGGINAADVMDVARAFPLAATRAPRGANYLLGGENLTNAAFLGVLREVLGVSSLRLDVGRASAGWLGRAVEGLTWAQGEDRGDYVTFNRNLASAMSLYWFVDDRRAERELGYSKTPVRPAIERQVAWLRAEGLLPPEGSRPDLLGFLGRFLRAPR